MKRYVTYFRVSSERQVEMNTVQSQKVYAQKYIANRNLNIVNSYEDDGVSGMLPLSQRPAGSRLMMDAANHEFDYILVYKLDRLGRDAVDTLVTIRDLNNLGIHIVSMTENINEQSTEDDLETPLRIIFADHERKKFLQRSRDGMERKAREGKYLGGIVPFGYTKTSDGYIAINDLPIDGHPEWSERKMVEYMYNSLVNDKKATSWTIANYFNGIGLPTAYGNGHATTAKRTHNNCMYWRGSAITRIVHSTVNKGFRQYGKRTKHPDKELIVQKVPAIVNADIWEKANEKLKSNQLEAVRNKKHNYLLHGLIYCGVCCHKYGGSAGKNNIRVYQCVYRSKHKVPNDPPCNNQSINAELLETKVLTDCNNYIHDHEKSIALIRKKMERKLPKTSKDEKKELAELTEALAIKAKERARIIDAYTSNIITQRDLKLQIAKITKETNALQHRKELILNANEVREKQEKYLTNIKNMLLKYQHIDLLTADYDTQRFIVKNFLNKIVIYPKEHLSRQIYFEYIFSDNNFEMGSNSPF